MSQKRETMVEILDATSEDAFGIAAVQKEAWLATYPNEEYGITLEDIKAKDWDNPVRVERWRKRIEESGEIVKIWVAKKEGKTIGFCSVERGTDKNRLQAIYILPEHQSRGIGQKLMQKALDWLGAEKDIVVEVAKYNAKAIGFYKKSGFQGERDVPPSPFVQLPSGKFIPDIEMIKPRQKSRGRR